MIPNSNRGIPLKCIKKNEKRDLIVGMFSDLRFKFLSVVQVLLVKKKTDFDFHSLFGGKIINVY